MCELSEKHFQKKDARSGAAIIQHLMRQYIEQVKQQTRVELKPVPKKKETDGFTSIRILLAIKNDRLRKEKTAFTPITVQADVNQSG